MEQIAHHESPAVGADGESGDPRGVLDGVIRVRASGEGRERSGAGWLAGIGTNLALAVVSLSIALAGMEIVSRLVMPVRATPFLDEVGRPVDIRDGLRLRANLRVRQTTTEFDVTYTTTPDGHRGPDAPGNPEMVFIGDSFTFGYGVNDEETFTHVFCSERRIACVNLGQIATGTGQQVEILRSFLEQEGWRPRRVRLMMFAMTGALMIGNDLVDNLVWEKHLDEYDPDGYADPSQSSRVARWLTSNRYALENLNLVRVALLYAGPMIRSRLSPAADRARVAETLEATGHVLGRLEALGRRYGFTWDLVLLHPMQDVRRGTDGMTTDAIRAVTPNGVDVRSTADALRRSPGRYYYSLDMHLNAAGHRVVADFLREAEEAGGDPEPTVTRRAAAD